MAARRRALHRLVRALAGASVDSDLPVRNVPNETPGECENPPLPKEKSTGGPSPGRDPAERPPPPPPPPVDGRDPLPASDAGNSRVRPVELSVVPIEFDPPAPARRRSIEREVTHPRYREVALERPVEGDPPAASDVPASRLQSVEQESTPPQIQNMQPEPRPGTIEREPPRPSTIPVEIDRKPDVTDMFRDRRQSIEREGGRPRYREIPLQRPVERVPSDGASTKNLKMQSIKQEYGTQEIHQNAPPEAPLSLIKREPYESSVIPVEFDRKPTRADILRIHRQAINREGAHPQYRETPFQRSIKREPYWNELNITRVDQKDPVHGSDVTSQQHQYPPKQELNQLNTPTRSRPTNSVPVISEIQQKSIKQELIQESSQVSYQMPLQRPVKTEPYWPQLNVPIKQELTNQQYPAGIHGMPAEHSFAKMPPWHQPEINPQKQVGLPVNTQPLQQSIKKELQYPTGSSFIPFEQHNNLRPNPMYRPESRHPNELGIPLNTLPQLKQELMTRQFDRIPEKPVVPMKKEPFWLEVDTQAGCNRNSADSQYKSIKQELIHQQYTTTGMQLSIKDEPIYKECAPHSMMTTSQYAQQLRESMTQRQPQNILQQIKTEPYLPQRVPTEYNLLGMQQQHQLHVIKREQNYDQPNLSLNVRPMHHGTDNIGSLAVQNKHIPTLIQQVPPEPVLAPPQTMSQQRQTQLALPEVPLQPLIPDTQRFRQNMISDILRQPFQSAQLVPNPLQQIVSAPGHQQTPTKKPRKRTQKDPIQKQERTEIPIMPPQASVTPNPFWHHQELLRQQHLAAGRLMTPILEAHRRQQYQYYLQNVAIRQQVPLPQYSNRQTNWLAEVPTAQQLPAATNPTPSPQKPKPRQKRAAKKPPEKPLSTQAQMFNYELQWQQQTARAQNIAARLPEVPPPQQPLMLVTNPKDLGQQHNLPTSWQQWQPLVSPLAPTTPAARTRATNPTRHQPYDETLLLQQRHMALQQSQMALQQRQMILQQQSPQASKRSKRKPPPFESILETYHQQENQQRQGLTQPGGQAEAPGHILRAALAANNDHYNTPF